MGCLDRCQVQGWSFNVNTRIYTKVNALNICLDLIRLLGRYCESPQQQCCQLKMRSSSTSKTVAYGWVSSSPISCNPIVGNTGPQTVAATIVPMFKDEVDSMLRSADIGDSECEGLMAEW